MSGGEQDHAPGRDAATGETAARGPTGEPGKRVRTAGLPARAGGGAVGSRPLVLPPAGPSPSGGDDPFALHLLADDPVAQPTGGGGQVAGGGTSWFKEVDKQPAGVEVLTLDVNYMDLPVPVRLEIGAATASLTNQKVKVIVQQEVNHKIGVYIEPEDTKNAKPVHAQVDLVEVATKLALGVAIATGAVTSFITGSKKPVLSGVGKDRIKLLLSKERDNGKNDFVVLDVRAIMQSLADGNYDGFRPLEAQIKAGPVTLSRYEGEELTDEDAFKNRGLRVDPDQAITVPGLRRLAFGEDSDAPVFVTAATDGKTLTLGFARDDTDDKGASISLDLARIVEIVRKVILKVAPAAGKALDKLLDGLAVAAKAGKQILKFIGSLLQIDLGGGDGGGVIGWVLEKILAAMVKIGSFTIDVLAALIPDQIHIPDIFIWDPPGPDGPLWEFPPIALIDLDPQILKDLLAAMGELGADVLGAAGSAAVLAAKLGIVVIDKARDLIGVIIDLFDGDGARKRRFGFALPFEWLAKIIEKAGKLLGKVAGKGAGWLADHVSLGIDGVLRVLLDTPPSMSGNRVGIDLVPFVVGRGDFSKLHLTETFLDGSVTDIKFGATDNPIKAPGEVVVQRPAGGALAETLIEAPGWMVALYGLPDKATLRSELIVGGGSRGGVHIWSSVVETDGAGSADDKPTRRGFDIELTLPQLVSKYAPNVSAKSIAINNKESQKQKRLVIDIGDLTEVPGGKKGLKGTFSWSLQQLLSAQSISDVLIPEQLVIDDGTWQLTAGKKVALKPWKNPVVQTMAPPPAVKAYLPVSAIDVYFRADKDSMGLLLADANDPDGDPDHAMGVALDVEKKRIEELKAKLPEVPGSVRDKLDLEFDATPDGLKIWLSDKASTSKSWVSYAWSTVVNALTGGGSIDDLIPHQAHLDASKQGLALDYSILKKGDVPVGGIKKQVKDLPMGLAGLALEFEVTEDHWFHLDTKQSELNADGTRIKVVGAVYRELGKDKVQGWKLGLEVDAVKLLEAFLPEKVIKQLKKKRNARGFDVGMEITDPDKNNERSLKVWLSYVKKGKKGKQHAIEVAASWTVHDLLELLVNLDDLDDDVGVAAPSKVSGELANDKYAIEISADHAEPMGTIISGAIPGFQQLVGIFAKPEVAAEAELWLNEDINGLPEKMVAALAKWEDLELASMFLVFPNAAGYQTYAIKVKVRPGEIANLAMLIPGGVYVKLGKLAIEFLQDPEAKLDDAFYLGASLPLLLEHADLFGKVDWDSLSATDAAMMMMMADDDMRSVYQALKAFDRLVDSGLIDKDKLPTLTGKDLKAGMAADREELAAEIAKINDTSMKDLKKLAKVKDAAGSTEQYNKILRFVSAIPPEQQELMGKLMSMYEKHGVEPDMSGAKDWSPDKAIQKLGTLEKTIKMLEAAVAGNRAEEAKRMLAGDKDGRDGEEAGDLARQHYNAHASGGTGTGTGNGSGTGTGTGSGTGGDKDDGKGTGPGTGTGSGTGSGGATAPTSTLDVTTLTAEELISIIQNGHVVLKGTNGPYVHQATAADKEAAGMQLLVLANVISDVDGTSVSPEDAIEVYRLNRSLYAHEEISTQLAGAGIKLSPADVAAAMKSNPYWFGVHKHGPKDFGAPNLDVASGSYVMHIARLQTRWGLTVDGIAGKKMVKMLEKQEKLADKHEAANGGDSAGKTGDSDGDGTGGAKDKGKGGTGGDGERSGRIPIPGPEIRQHVYYREDLGRLELMDNAKETWLANAHEKKLTVVNSDGLAGKMTDLKLKQWRVSRDSDHASPQIGFQLEITAMTDVPDEDGRHTSFTVYTTKSIFIVDFANQPQGGYAWARQLLPHMDEAIEESVDQSTGAIKKKSIKVKFASGHLKAKVADVTDQGPAWWVYLDVVDAPPGVWLYDIEQGRYVEVTPGRLVVQYAKPKREPESAG